MSVRESNTILTVHSNRYAHDLPVFSYVSVDWKYAVVDWIRILPPGSRLSITANRCATRSFSKASLPAGAFRVHCTRLCQQVDILAVAEGTTRTDILLDALREYLGTLAAYGLVALDAD